MYFTQLAISLYAVFAVQQQPVTLSPAPALSLLASQEYSLLNRHPVESVNQVFSDNILLTLAYMSGDVQQNDAVDWEQLRQPRSFHFVLQPGESFAFHDVVKEEFQDSVVRTTNAHFIWDEGFKSDGWLVGDGVCHLASFIHVAADQAGLEVVAPTRHDFAQIPDVAREDGTSIYFDPNSFENSSRQNLYIRNSTGKPIAFIFEYTPESSVKVEIKTVNLVASQAL